MRKRWKEILPRPIRKKIRSSKLFFLLLLSLLFFFCTSTFCFVLVLLLFLLFLIYLLTSPPSRTFPSYLSSSYSISSFPFLPLLLTFESHLTFITPLLPLLLHSFVHQMPPIALTILPHPKSLNNITLLNFLKETSSPSVIKFLCSDVRWDHIIVYYCCVAYDYLHLFMLKSWWRWL